MGHVVWRWKILSGECSGPMLILLSGDIFFPFFRSEAERLTVYGDSHPLNYCNKLFALYLLSFLFPQCKHILPPRLKFKIIIKTPRLT